MFWWNFDQSGWNGSMLLVPCLLGILLLALHDMFPLIEAANRSGHARDIHQ